MEIEIIKLIDRMANSMIDLMRYEYFYISNLIPKGSKIGIITNLNHDDLNYLYYSFIANGYHVASIQANSLNNTIFTNTMESFKYITSSGNSYQIISGPRRVKFLYGTWAGQKYNEKIDYINQMYQTYDVNYLEAKLHILDKLKTYHNLDTILIIGFNQGKNNAWLRCIDVRRKDLIWMQSNISGSFAEICVKMIKTMSSDINPKIQ